MNLTKKEIDKKLLSVGYCYEDLLNIIAQQCKETEDGKSFGGFWTSTMEDKQAMVKYKDTKENGKIVIKELTIELEGK